MTDAIETAVIEMVEDILSLDPGEATLDTRFIQDLNGESIDLLDLSFRCQQRFNTKVRFQDMMDPKFLNTDADGLLTPDSLVWLRDQFPFLDLAEFSKEPRLNRMMELLTVRAIAGFVRRALEAGPSAPAAEAAATPA